jgi:hypothetical protein
MSRFMEAFWTLSGSSGSDTGDSARRFLERLACGEHKNILTCQKSLTYLFPSVAGAAGAGHALWG